MNKVVIHVESVNDTKAGFDASRRDAENFGHDVETEMDKAGGRAGKKLGSSIGKDAKKDGKAVGEDIGNTFIKGLVQIADGVAPKLTKTIAGSLEDVGPIAGPALVSVIAGTAPLIGASLSGAIIGGAGLGGILGGVLIASKDPAVQAAATTMKTTISAQLTDAAKPFVATSISGITRIGGAVQKINFGQIFADSAKNTAPIITGVVNLVGDLGDAFTTLIHNAGPVLDEIGAGISGVGRSLKSGLDSLADNGKEGADALTSLFGVIEFGTKSVFALVNGLTETYGLLEKIPGGTGVFGLFSTYAKYQQQQADGQTTVTGAIEGTVAAVIQNISATDTYGLSVQTAGASLEDMAAAADAATTAQLALFGSFTDVGAAEDAATASAKKNGKTLDEHTEKGRANRTALQNLATALKNNYDNYKDLNGIGPKTDAVMKSNRTAFINAATAAGASKDEAKKLADAIIGIPAKKTPVIHASVTGQEKLDAMGHRIGGITSKSVTITAHVSITGEERLNALGHRIGGFARGGVKGAASGGPQNGLTLVGEEGPELVNLPAGAMVQTAGASARAMAGAAGGGGWGGQPIIFQIDGKTVFKAILPHAQKTNRGLYANDAQRMWAG